MVPNGWEVKKLQDIVSQDRKITYGIVVPGPFEEDGNLMIRAKDYSFGWQPIDSIYRVSDKIHQSYRRSQVRQGDILLTIVGSVGNTAVVPEYLDGANITQQTARLSFDKNIGDFFHLLLDSDIGKREIYRYVKSGVQPSLNLSDIAKFLLPVPPLPEQQKIAKILTTWDKAIDATERFIDNSKQQKKALMQQLLTGKKRLLDNEGKPFEGEWEESRVGDFGEIYSGGTPSTTKSTYWDGDIDWITPTDITKQDKRYINCSQRRITKEGLKNSSAKLVPAGSLLVCTRATIGAMAITSHAMCTNQGFKNIIPNDDYDIEFIYYLLSFNPNQLIRRASGSTFLELSKSEFEAIKFKTPQLKEQQKIAAVLTNADKEIELLEQQLADLQQEKKALMQQLLTGKKRVGVA